MTDIPKGNLGKDWYWPLASLSYSPEIRDFFPEEAEMIGVITILWNRQELALRGIFLKILDSRSEAFGESIWDRQPTHQARRELLSAALETAKMTKRAKAILTYVIDKTKVMADRRNELMHAEYVVHGRTDKLHAKVKPPRSIKDAKYQKLAISDLQTIINDLDDLLGVTEYNMFEFLSPKARRQWNKIGKELADLSQRLESPQIDSDLQSPPNSRRRILTPASIIAGVISTGLSRCKASSESMLLSQVYNCRKKRGRWTVVNGNRFLWGKFILLRNSSIF